MNPLVVQQGNSPIILGQPHGGTYVPADILVRLNDRGRELTDTDWHIHRLYDGLFADVTVVQAIFHRYVIDANRDPAGGSLYPGQNTTELCPITDFDGLPIWDQPPDAVEIERRRQVFHAPYHAALAAEIARVTARHGLAVVFDCHSIRSTIPFLFLGFLPIFNIGTNGGLTCAPELSDAVAGEVSNPDFSKSKFTAVLNGRFKGGWTTRHYGKPEDHVHAIQLEIAQTAYLETENAPWTYSPGKAAPVREVLRNILSTLDTIARSGDLTGARHA